MIRAIVVVLVLLWSASAVAETDPWCFWYDDTAEWWPHVDEPRDEQSTPCWQASCRGSGGEL